MKRLAIALLAAAFVLPTFVVAQEKAEPAKTEKKKKSKKSKKEKKGEEPKAGN